jgi:hypothetical protein
MLIRLTSSASCILPPHPARPFEERPISRQQHCIFDKRRRNNDAIQRITMEVVELGGQHRNLGR